MFEIRINPASYSTFLAFLQFLYGIEPEVGANNILDLLNMAKVLDEPDLTKLCLHWLDAINTSDISVANVCSFYELAVTRAIPSLESRCLEFAKNNWKVVFKSDQFQAMDEKLSMRLMREVAKSQ